MITLPGCQRDWEICDTASLLITSLSAFSSLPALLRPAATTSIIPTCQAAWLQMQRRNTDREEASKGLTARGRVTCVPRCVHGATFKLYNGMEYRPSHTCRKMHSPSRVYAKNTKRVSQQRSDIIHCIIRLKENDMVISVNAGKTYEKYPSRGSRKQTPEQLQTQDSESEGRGN